MDVLMMQQQAEISATAKGRRDAATEAVAVVSPPDLSRAAQIIPSKIARTVT